MTPDGLRISRSLALPSESVTKTFAILAQRRKGKTYTASVMAEEMVKVGIPWVALDPTGAWWGLRAGADGTRKGGLRVYVFGGDHGDLPLERTAGRQIADLVVEHPGHYVLDFSHFDSKEAERQLATDFAERFYRRKGRDKAPMHLFVDEADLFVPQQSPSGDKRMVGAFESIVRRGGIRGVGTTLISQRAAVVNKNVLEQIDVLITLRVVGPNDRKAILKGYIEAHGDPKQQAAMLDSLASLPLGEAWIWEPGADLFERVKIRKRHTFNSSATPDGKADEPVGLADVNLDALRGKLDRAIEQAKANDPAELKKRIRELEREVKKRPTDTKEIEVEKIVEVPVLAPDVTETLTDAVNAIRGAGAQLGEIASGISRDLARAGRVPQTPVQPGRRKPSPPPRERRREPAGDVGEAPMGQVGDGEVKLKAGARRMLRALAYLHPEPLTRIQVGTLADVAPGGTFSAYLSALRAAGYVVEDSGRGELALTASGVEQVSDDIGAGAPSADELREMWGRKLKAGARRMLELLAESYPDGISRAELGEQADVAPGGTFSAYLSSLRRNNLATERSGLVYAGEALFIGERV